ncbi:hypothetical protein NIES593_12930 [Hydrococcus rivularis NIES-593]|uniref:DUF2808 domain-containing protein n=1 Tax=Hydrococcus rivularis NIES-593 TaxID=1921803 RepID=A0A1U7HFL4_9CYAN|nr:DUF2808 domain-containing protein [Hydrococcus rivularis]OKH22373.1 hypothetical protein NIES593_12930 [Hydrococcus rivularis NIES-593]
MSRTTDRNSWLSLKTGAISFESAVRIAASTLILGTLISIPPLNLPASAYELSTGQTVFFKSPRLIRAAASQNAPGAASTYQFTIEVPKNAGEALAAVTITHKPSPERIKFDVSQSKAFIGDSFAGGPQLALSSIGGSDPSEENSVTIAFDEPVEPGTTVTVSLRALRNPDRGGNYQFGVTAYPVGENSLGLYLGTARLQFMPR